MEPKEMKFNELTHKLCALDLTVEEFDMRVRDWLEEKVDKIIESSFGFYQERPMIFPVLRSQLNEILGLSDQNVPISTNLVGEDKPVEKKYPYGKPWVCDSCGSTWDCWYYCAKCGTKRPEEKKKLLWEILKSSVPDHDFVRHEILKSMASRTITAVIEVWERWYKEARPGTRLNDFPDYLRKELDSE